MAAKKLETKELYEKVKAGNGNTEERIDLLERMVDSLIKRENDREGNEPFWSSRHARQI